MTVPSLKDQVPGASCPDLGNKAPSPSAIDFCLLFACRVSEASLGPNAAAEWRPAALLGSLTFGRQRSCCSRLQDIKHKPLRVLPASFCLGGGAFSFS